MIKSNFDSRVPRKLLPRILNLPGRTVALHKEYLSWTLYLNSRQQNKPSSSSSSASSSSRSVESHDKSKKRAKKDFKRFRVTVRRDRKQADRAEIYGSLKNKSDLKPLCVDFVRSDLREAHPLDSCDFRWSITTRIKPPAPSPSLLTFVQRLRFDQTEPNRLILPRDSNKTDDGEFIVERVWLKREEVYAISSASLPIHVTVAWIEPLTYDLSEALDEAQELAMVEDAEDDEVNAQQKSAETVEITVSSPLWDDRFKDSNSQNRTWSSSAFASEFGSFLSCLREITTV
eukprot:TRINITY_DN2024_c0_g1_i2.p1 TRINITY_DN2024_c0_g1~~TRINITY_DN2024_c0_g1_i2.p1  ORF type:complete len:288 (+),score=81.17 TRINITY_DN2024_c0_g1_i2:1147-2010(+)